MANQEQLLIKVAKYLKSEGIYYSYTKLANEKSIIACINSNFIVFTKRIDVNDIHYKRIIKNRGLFFSPSNLDDFIKIMVSLQGD